jgi:hypothetical protein
LGGEYRFLPEGSVYGVHRFFWKEPSAANADVAQIMSAAVVEYIKSMDVDTKIFALASQAGQSEAITPSRDTLLALNVINDGRKPVKWTIESITGAIYLKGEQETSLGINKFILICPASHRPMALYVIFDAGQNTNEVMGWQTNWLFVDGSQMQIGDRLLEKKVLNGWINLTYRLDNQLLSVIAGAKSEIGVGLAATPQAAVFDGFAHMPIQGGAAKLPGFLQVCGRR